MKIGSGEFLHGDCLDLMARLPDASVDMICTDPPYGMGYRSNRRPAEKRHREIANDKELSWLPRFVEDSFRLAKPDTGHYFFCSWHQIDIFKKEIERRFRLKNILVWEKDNHSTGDLAGDFAPKHELILFAHKGRALIRGKRDCNILKFSRTRNELHPTQKPVDLIGYLISKFSDPGQTVLDPFAGSGTTAIAAEQSDRQWICMEQDVEYYAKAVARVAQHVA